jgi:hypothetical protein
MFNVKPPYRAKSRQLKVNAKTLHHDTIQMPSQKPHLQKRNVPPTVLAAVFFIHLVFSWYAAQTPLIRSYDTLFDLDQLPQIQRWIETDTTQLRLSVRESEFLIRHPGGYLPRLVFRPLIELGIPTHGAIALVLSAGATVGVWLVGCLAHRSIKSPWMATLATLTLSFMSSSYLPFLVVETFTFSYLFILAAFAELARSKGTPTRLFAILSLAAAMMTITNIAVLLCGLIGFAFSHHKHEAWKVLRAHLVQMAPIFVLAATLSVGMALYYVDTSQILSTDGLRRSYWIAASTEKTEFVNVLLSFTALSIAAPAVAVVPGMADSWGAFADYRHANYSFLAGAACTGGLALLIYGMWRSLRYRDPIGICAAMWLAFNITLHLVWQSKGSVYLFSMHAAPALILLMLKGWPNVNTRLMAGILLAWATLLFSANGHAMILYLRLDPLFQVAREDIKMKITLCSQKEQLQQIQGASFLQPAAFDVCLENTGP